MRLISAAVLALGLGGCGALAGGAGAGLSGGLEGGPIPAPPPGSSVWEWIAYTGAGLVAYTAGSLGKAYIRAKIGGGEEEKA